MKTKDGRERIGINGLYAPLFATSKPCCYGKQSEFTKHHSMCGGVVTCEGNRMPVCARHRLVSAFESQDGIARAIAELYERATVINMRVRALSDMYHKGE